VIRGRHGELGFVPDFLLGDDPQAIRDLYEHRAEHVFADSIWDDIRDLGKILGADYDVENLRHETQTLFGNRTLGQLSKRVLVTTFDLDNEDPQARTWKPKIFHNFEGPDSDGSQLASKIATYTCAAPTYFAPWVIPGLADRGPMVDGGTGVAGNPTYQACVEAFEYADGYRPDGTVIVSLGTGHFLRRRPPGWLYDWLGWLLAELLRSPGEQQTELVSRHFGEAAFYRIDVRLDRDYPLDGVGQMAALRQVGERLADRIDWPAVLDGSSDAWRVTRANRRPEAYAAEV